MKQRLVDIIACPNDNHFPLEINVDTAVESVAKAVACDTYCARSDAFLKELPVEPGDCRACSTVEVVSGELYCPTCGNSFKIEDGIPRLLAEQSFGDDAPGRDKASEMQARDEQAPFYDRFMRWRLWARYEKPKMIKLLAPKTDDLVIELGAGTGRFSAAVAGRASELVAVDFSVDSLRQSRATCKDGTNIHWVQADINYLPFRDCVADRILSCQVFEHLPGAAARDKAVDEAARIIKGGGAFAISVYRHSWSKRRSGDKEGYHYGGIYYCRLTANEFTEMLGRKFHIKQLIPNLGFYLQAAKCVKEKDALGANAVISRETAPKAPARRLLLYGGPF